MNQGEHELLRQAVAENIKMRERYENVLNELDNLWTSLRELQDSHDDFYEKATSFRADALKWRTCTVREIEQKIK
jgi:hypothetical protein